MRVVFASVVAAVIAGCGPSASTSLPGAAASSISPQGKTSDLLYVSQDQAGYVYAFDYPRGTLKRTLSTPGGGLCSDAKGNVYVTDFDLGKIYVYAHGALRPKRALEEPNLDPEGCAVDPTTGNLAVANHGSGEADIAIFKDARGAPNIYYDSGVIPFVFCSYDASGNLFADGWSDDHDFRMVELPKGGRSLANVSLDQFVSAPGAIVWDGKDLVVSDTTDRVYRFRMRKMSGKEVGYTTFGGVGDGIDQFVLSNGSLIGAISSDNDVVVWNFPAGGSPIKRIRVGSAYGLALSPANDRKGRK